MFGYQTAHYANHSYQTRRSVRPQSSEPRTMPAKFDSVCPKCGQAIVADETMIVWTPGQKAVHLECPADHGIEEWEATVDRQPVVGPTQPVASVTRLAVEDAGVYVLPDGRIVKVQANREKTRVYTKLFVQISGERLTEDETHVHGEYRYEPGLLPEVEATGRKMTLEEAKAFMLRYGFCARCGRRLKAAESVERGIGPVCMRYFEGA